MPNYKYEVGNIINGFKILDKRYINETWTKKYSLKCMKCGYEFEREEKRLATHGCNCCLNRIALKGFNDISTTNPDFIKYFKDINDAYICTINSEKKIWFKCPICGNETNKKVYNFFKNGIHCTICGTKGSYPERFIKSMLNQIGIKHETQKIFDWSNRKRYDFYVPSLSLIIETHGEQHYKECSITTNTLLEEQNNDMYKEKIAIDNGIKYYIQLDCRKSNIVYIKSSILNSKIKDLFDLSVIDWDRCVYEYNGQFYDICKYYNENETSARKMTDVFKISRPTIVEYLKIGNELGLCEYNEEKIEQTRKEFAKESLINLHSNKEIICLNDLKIFNTYSECARHYNCHGISISKCCNKENHYVLNRNNKKLFFLFKDEYLNMSEEEINEIINFKQKISVQNYSYMKNKMVIDTKTSKIFNSVKEYMEYNGIKNWYGFNKNLKDDNVKYYCGKEE